jgi:flavin reductase (DIM6/NTAB) family NADH-FMN oxidoreductase RutF
MPIRNALGLFERVERELWLVTAAHAGARGGLIATFVAPASIVPTLPRIIVGLSKLHETEKLVQASHALAVHLLDESLLELVWRFGLQSGRDVDKFEGLAWRAGPCGSPILDGAMAWLECRVETTTDIGDRTIFLAEVADGESRREGTPLTTRRMSELAPPEKLAVLREQMAVDAEKDTDAIRRWRTQHVERDA